MPVLVVAVPRMMESMVANLPPTVDASIPAQMTYPVMLWSPELGNGVRPLRFDRACPELAERVTTKGLAERVGCGRQKHADGEGVAHGRWATLYEGYGRQSAGQT